MRTLLLTLFAALTASAQVSVGLGAGLTSWGYHFEELVPGWANGTGLATSITRRAHPIGYVDVKYQPPKWKVALFARLEGDPHRAGEASGASFGLSGNLVSKGRFALFGEASVGKNKGPNFSEYGCTYEWKGCYIDGPPEECWWATANLAAGTREALTKRIALEQLMEYKSPYGIGPRWSLKIGARVGL